MKVREALERFDEERFCYQTTTAACMAMKAAMCLTGRFDDESEVNAASKAETLAILERHKARSPSCTADVLAAFFADVLRRAADIAEGKG